MRLWPKKAKYESHEARDGAPVNIVADAAIATGPVGDGRLIPLAILNTISRPDINEMIRIHEHLPPGDVIHQWGSVIDDANKIVLLLNFKRPAEITAWVIFDVFKQAGLIDQILNVKALYIQGGKEGDRFSTTIDSPRILLELPESGFREPWDKIYLSHTVKKIRSEGFSRQEARKFAKEFIRQHREFGQLRVGIKYNDSKVDT
ncbi:hypothetical protein [Ferrovibrio sp.]|uniref:hypothetical protein n=1 Tax=Ferrovibrio sp. TaxID=1917215 RepID=UPI003D2E2D7F